MNYEYNNDDSFKSNNEQILEKLGRTPNSYNDIIPPGFKDS
jgi:hypothetical protein